MSLPIHGKYISMYHDQWAWSLAIKGCTMEEIARSLGVKKSTLYDWMYTKDAAGNKVLTSFGEALQMGREAADAAVEKKLFERCMGFKKVEKKQILDVNKDGSSKLGQIITTETDVPPDTMAMMYWLNNRKRHTGEWSQRQEVKMNLGDDTDGVVIYIPDNGRDKDEQS